MTPKMITSEDEKASFDERQAVEVALQTHLHGWSQGRKWQASCGSFSQRHQGQSLGQSLMSEYEVASKDALSEQSIPWARSPTFKVGLPRLTFRAPPLQPESSFSIGLAFDSLTFLSCTRSLESGKLPERCTTRTPRTKRVSLFMYYGQQRSVGKEGTTTKIQ
ncbi:expressed unknown protein [Seminavis robusta]|uniref:Uncharacterized protein n=1 Tax=Seminavis robusta TaxID=568900 RepID=A0A9N8EZI3_9STRA|nr:expressed unknown protein [Seminavis robusta]|eukprot:Sro2100_g314491.1  (163) ;mRNA; f:6404-6892